MKSSYRAMFFAAAATLGPWLAPLQSQAAPQAQPTPLELAIAKFELERDPTALEALVAAAGADADAARAVLQGQGGSGRGAGAGQDELTPVDRNAVVNAVVQWIAHENASTGAELDWLGRRAVPHLIEAFEKQVYDLSLLGRIAVKILQLGGPDALQWLIRQHDEASGLRREVIVRALVDARAGGRYPRSIDEGLADGVRRFLNDKDSAVRKRLIAHYPHLIEPEAYGKWLSDPDEGVSVAAIRALAPQRSRATQVVAGQQQVVALTGAERDRVQAYCMAVRSLATRKLSEAQREAIQLWLGAHSGYDAVAGLGKEGVSFIEALLPQFRFSVTTPARGADVLRVFNRVVEARAPRANEMATWIGYSRSNWGSADLAPLLEMARRWYEVVDAGEAKNPGVGTVMQTVSMLIKFAKPEDGAALAAILGDGDLWLNPSALNTASQELRRATAVHVRPRLMAGDFEPASQTWSSVLILALVPYDAAAYTWLRQYHEATKLPSLCYFVDSLQAEEANEAQLRYFLRRTAELSSAEKNHGLLSSLTELSSRLLIVAGDEAKADVETAIRAGMTVLRVPLRRVDRSQSVVNLMQALLEFDGGRYVHHDLEDATLLAFVRACFETTSDFTPIQWCHGAGANVRFPNGFFDALLAAFVPRADAVEPPAAGNVVWFLTRNFERLADPGRFVHAVLGDRDGPMAKRFAEKLLLQLRSTRVVEYQRLALPFLGFESAAIGALNRVEDEAIVAALDARVRELLSSADAAQRRAALQMISMHGAPQFLKLALTALDDSDVLVRKAAIEVFVRHYHEAAADGLLRALRDEHKENRDLAKQALDAMRHIQEQEQHWKAWRLARQQPSVSAALLAQTKDSEPMEVRLAALRSIGLLGDVEALPFLIDAMKSEDAQIREAAKEAVATLQAIAAKRTK